MNPRHVRVPDDLWAAFKAKVAEEGQTITAVIIRLIRRYIDEP